MRSSILLTAIFLAGFADQAGPGSEPALTDASSSRGASCKPPGRDAIGAADVAIAIDTSMSTARPSGSDIDLDGRIGELTNGDMTDPGDSLLAAEVAGVRALVRHAAELDLRFSIVTFSGRREFPIQLPPENVQLRAAAVIQTALTHDIGTLEATLDRVLELGGDGKTNFAAGMKQALQTLADAEPSSSARRGLVLFISDSPTPVLAGPNDEILREDPRMKRTAEKAIEVRTPIHTFGLGRAAATPPPHALSRIAGATGGTYHAVDEPVNLHCQLLSALAPLR